MTITMINVHSIQRSTWLSWCGYEKLTALISVNPHETRNALFTFVNDHVKSDMIKYVMGKATAS